VPYNGGLCYTVLGRYMCFIECRDSENKVSAVNHYWVSLADDVFMSTRTFFYIYELQ